MSSGRQDPKAAFSEIHRILRELGVESIDVAGHMAEMRGGAKDGGDTCDPATHHVAWCHECGGEVTTCDEDRCCLTCGVDLIVLADRHSAEVLAALQDEALAEVERLRALLRQVNEVFSPGGDGLGSRRRADLIRDVRAALREAP